MDRVLITGANGLLGSKLIELYGKHKDHIIFATSRGVNRFQKLPSNATYQALDIAEESQVEAVLSYLAPQAVIHTAAMTNVDQCELNHEECLKQNVTAVEILSRVCSKMGIFLLHLSTDFIFDGKNGPYRETDKPAPISFYGQTKLKAEQIIQSTTGLQWAIARTVLVYGYAPGLSRSNIVLWARQNLMAGKEIQVVDDQWRTPTLAEDLAMGCYLIVDNASKGIYHLSGPDLFTPYDIAQAVADHFKLDKKLIHRANAGTFSQPASRPPRTGFIIDKARTELGYSPHTFKDGLALLQSQLEAQSTA
jgi:dTDP-4-dehydrorhamnose reductase